MKAGGTTVWADATVWAGTGRVARKLVITVLETCGGRAVEVPISKGLSHGATINMHRIPSKIIFNGLAVNIARVKKVAIL